MQGTIRAIDEGLVEYWRRDSGRVGGDDGGPCEAGNRCAWMVYNVLMERGLY